MIVGKNIKQIYIEVVSLLFILLFVYAALNKLLDFENFQVQLAQSPLLSSFAEVVSYLIPISELLIAFLLCFRSWRLVGLLCGYMLMLMFSTYIFIMLHFSPFVPCSCGGILDELSWNEHLIFNLVFVILGGVAAFLISMDSGVRYHMNFRDPIVVLVVGSILSISIVFLLFYLSEDMIRHRNNFTRRFPHHPLGIRHEYNLNAPTYYIAGIDDEHVFLGDANQPLLVHVADSSFKIQKQFPIALKSDYRYYRSLRLSVLPPHFFISDGRESFIFKGLIKNWRGYLLADKVAYFNAIVPVDSSRFVVRSISSTSNEHVLGLIKTFQKPRVSLFPILEKQLDGIFDTSGSLLYNEHLEKIIYTYTYRNEFLISDINFKKVTTGNTIDTTSKANIRVSYLESKGGSKISSPSRQVNITTATYGDYLFVNSGLIGQFEPRDMWDEASIIDVYNLTDQSYEFSFYVYDKKGKKMRDFVINRDRLYALVGNYVVVYKLENDFYNQH